MGVSKTKRGWRYDRENSRLDFYFDGQRIGAINSGGIDLADTMTFEVLGSAISGSLDTAYDGQNEIAVDGDPVILTGSHGSNDTLQIVGNSSGALIDFTQAGGGKDIEGTGDTWTVSAAGAAVFTTIAGTSLTLSSNIDMSAETSGTYNIILNTGQADALSIRQDGTDMMVFDSTTPRVTITPATTITGAVTLSSTLDVAGLLTVSTGGAAITGNATFADDLTVSGNMDVAGALTFGGNWTVTNTLTVDELVLGTNGSISSLSGSAYVISDNTGDLNVNALSGRSFNIQVNGSDEYVFTSTILTMNSNHISGAGYIDLSDVTIGQADNVRIGQDNTGDLILNARTSKDINFTISGAVEARVKTNELELATGTNLQFLGNDAIVDSAGAKVIAVEAVASANTYLSVKNAQNASVELEALGSSNRGFIFKNHNNEELLSLIDVGSADTEITIVNASASDPIIRSTGTADKGVIFQNTASEPTFQIDVTGTIPVNWLTIDASDTGVQVIFSNDGEEDVGMLFNAKDAEEMLSLKAATAAFTYVEITSGVTGTTGPIIGSTGETNVNLQLAPAGTGQLDIVCGTTGTASRPDIVIAGDVNTGVYAPAADKLAISTGGTVRTEWSVTGQKVGGTADHAGTAGTNVISVFNGTAPVGALSNGGSIFSEAGEVTAIDSTGATAILVP